MKSDAYIMTDRALHADLLAAIAEHRASVLFDSEDTLLLREQPSGVFMLASRNPAETEALLKDLYEQAACVVLHGSMMDSIAERSGFMLNAPCYQVLYEKGPLPAAGSLIIRHPDEKDFPIVSANYSLCAEDELWTDFSGPDFIGGYADGKFVGFIGLHCEGSIGMLTVLPEYRRRGYAEQIYSVIINNQLKQGRLPYAQVYTDNTNSLNLQRKLGFTFSGDTIMWCWREEA